MAEIRLKIKVEGMDRVRRKLQKDALWAKPIQRFLERAARTIELHAKEKAPVDTGRLRASIGFQVMDLPTMQAIIAPKAHYGAYVEFGTRPHWPPLKAMQPWAQRHGFPRGRAGAFLLALAISRHGTKAHPYMRPAAEQSKGAIQRFARDAAEETKQNWQREGGR